MFRKLCLSDNRRESGVGSSPGQRRDALNNSLAHSTIWEQIVLKHHQNHVNRRTAEYMRAWIRRAA